MLRIEARRSALPWIAVVTGLAAAVAQPATASPLVVSRAAVATAAAEPVSTGDRAIFEPVAPVRLLDTRKTGPAIGAKAERVLQVSGVAGVPADALAVVVNVTAVLPTASGYLTVYPTGVTPRPTASTVNFLAKQVVANLATVQLGDGGRVSIYNALNATTGGTHVVMDLAGFYRSHAHDDRYLLESQAQGRTAPGAFTCVTGVLKSVAADGAPTCVSTPASAEYFAGFGLTLTDGVFAAEQGRNAPNAFTCTVGSYLQAVAKDGAPTCAADKDTDTKYTAGSGLALTGTTFSAEQGRSAAGAFTCSIGSYLQAVAANGAPTCVADSDTKYTAGSGLALTGNTFSAEQGRSAAGAFTCSIGSYLQAVAANGAPTCAADKDTDTKYTAGSGLALTGTTFSAEQGRSAPNAFFCESGTYLRAVSATGAPTCATDTGVQFTTGLGLLLSNGVLSAEQGRSATNSFTCQVGSYLRIVAQNGAPTCAPDVDTDTNTTYEPGFGLYLDGNVFAAEQGRSAKFAFFCEEGNYLREVAADGTPTCGADAVGPTYTAGAGIDIIGGTISAHQRRSATNAFACPAGQALRVVGADGAPTCTTAGYTAGPGLSLNGTTFSSAYGATVIPVRADATPTENGTLLRNAMAAVVGATAEKPYVLALAPGTYELGGNPLTMKPYVSVVGAGRGFTTITGARVSQSGGLVNLGDNTTLAGVTVRNMVPAGTSFVTAIMSNGANVARLFDVHGYASQEGGEVFGLLAFAGGLITVENSQFTAINPTTIGTGIYSISNSTVRARNVEVGHGAVGGWALHAYNNSRIEFADGYANGPVRKGTADSTVHLTHSKVDGIVNGGVLCFGAFTSAMAAATCT